MRTMKFELKPGRSQLLLNPSGPGAELGHILKTTSLISANGGEHVVISFSYQLGNPRFYKIIRKSGVGSRV